MRIITFVFFLVACATNAATANYQIIELKDDDIICYNYQASSHSCASTAKISIQKDGRVLSSEYSEINYSSTRLRMNLVTQTNYQKNTYCLEKLNKLSVERPDGGYVPQKFKQLLSNQFDMLANSNLCSIMIACEDTIYSLYYLNNHYLKEVSGIVKILSKEDPARRKLKLRVTKYPEDYLGIDYPFHCAPSRKNS